MVVEYYFRPKEEEKYRVMCQERRMRFGFKPNYWLTVRPKHVQIGGNEIGGDFDNGGGGRTRLIEGKGERVK